MYIQASTLLQQGLIFLREFLPLPCFHDRNLKQMHRERKFSYREFMDKGASSEESRDLSSTPFGLGKRAQPLKVLARDVDPTADKIIDLLVCFHSPSIHIS